MQARRIAVVLGATLLLSNAPLLAQRPLVGLGIGGGVVLGSQLADQGFVVRIDDREISMVQQVDLNDVAVASAHVEWYALPNLALRAHGAWGEGRLQISTYTDSDGVLEPSTPESGSGDVGVRALDLGVSVWPWAPRTVGFAPFFTIGLGSYDYDFRNPDDEATSFRAVGRRSGRALMVGLGADMQVWRAITLRMEAVNHLVDSPLHPADFAYSTTAGATGGLDDRVNNVRLIVGAHIYLPFRALDWAPRR